MEKEKQHDCQLWLARTTVAAAAQIRDLTGEEAFAGLLEVRKRKEHCIFTIEACGSTPAPVLFERALAILKAKCTRLNSML